MSYGSKSFDKSGQCYTRWLYIHIQWASCGHRLRGFVRSSSIIKNSNEQRLPHWLMYTVW